ncbi:MAG TPA: hypothetical protein VG942_18935 [Hyphomonadaceae bacterium]|nr:hypothetical protein [Hyphomonadaceae bacterium]
MLHASTQQLIRKLCELTDKGQIAWKEGERKCSVFETEGYSIEVEADPPTVRLLRSDGAELERADAADLAEAAWPGGDGSYATQVADMARRAHRVARGAEAAISKILSSLSSPQKTPELDPLPASLEFDEPAQPKRPAPVTASESAAALAAATADMEARRKAAAEPPPSPHTPPEPSAHPAEIVQADTAIERVLAIQPATQQAATAIKPAAPEATLSVQVQPSTSEQQPEPQPTVSTAAVAPNPEPEPSPSLPETTRPMPLLKADPAPISLAVPSRSVSTLFSPGGKPAAKPGFGSIDSFSRPGASLESVSAQPEKVRATAPASKVTSTGLLFSGYSARTRQTALGMPPSATPSPVSPQSQPTEKPPAAAISGPDVYKPWS